jgi:8-oxo-dGTP diphosphatase
MRITVVRHGQAEPKSKWKGADGDRPLMARGRRQADRLGKVIGTSRPTRVISSPAVRCVQTVQPFAARRNLTVEVSPMLATDAGKAAVDLCRELIGSERRDANVLLCTHREVLNVLLPQLAKDFDRKLGHRLPGAKGGAWVLRFRDNKLVKIEYRPPAG